ncbi:hypothetical protein H6F78_09745 [Coleofasciculus sp. FACHB-64]|uniref:hypothetical protein n=1 Tax=Cyanophyceae TaxID=3028117 RepID=UPI001681FA66|nr:MULTISPECIES: hypothetical protein [unclassified Coleofasciculus]MBD1838644.1 hypothetical protein [Coleofasciculus sp. FACHB-501]MBD2045879.1 hypothetical protein [Coleofasciculus sp. FACHB-64]MBD2086282.1 hypothetical protein [Coleofasciculus sp. FACHB-542]
MAASTQNKALSALLFLYQDVLKEILSQALMDACDRGVCAKRDRTFSKLRHIHIE